MSSWKGIGLLLFAAVLAAVAGGMAYLYLSGTSAEAEGTAAATVPIVVASQDLTFGTKLDEKDLRIVEFPESSVPMGAYSSVDTVVAQTTKVFLVAGEPVLASKLSSVGGGLSVRIPEAKRASSIEVNEVSGVSGFILPGDIVDVLCTIDNAPGQTQGVAVTKTILQNIEVLAAGVKTKTNKKDPIRVQAVTLLVNPKEAEDLALGMFKGRIHLVLRNPVDHELVTVKSTNTREVFGLVQAKKRTTKRPRRTVVRKPKKAAEATYTIIRDGSIQEQKSPTKGGAGGTRP